MVRLLGPEGYHIHIASAAADGPKSAWGPQQPCLNALEIDIWMQGKSPQLQLSIVDCDVSFCCLRLLLLDVRQLWYDDGSRLLKWSCAKWSEKRSLWRCIVVPSYKTILLCHVENGCTVWCSIFHILIIPQRAGLKYITRFSSKGIAPTRRLCALLCLIVHITLRFCHRIGHIGSWLVLQLPSQCGVQKGVTGRSLCSEILSCAEILRALSASLWPLTPPNWSRCL